MSELNREIEEGCPVWLSVVEELFPAAEDRETLRQMFGYCLSPPAEQRLLNWFGGPATGKSTVAAVLMACVVKFGPVKIAGSDFMNAFFFRDWVSPQPKLCVWESGTMTRGINGRLLKVLEGSPVKVETAGGGV